MVCWAYNESELIEEFLERAHRLMTETVEDFEIVIVDDGSADGTAGIIEQVAGRLGRIRLLKNETNRNVAYSAWRALNAAEKEFVFCQTIDWAYDIRALRFYLELLRDHDVVAGTRRATVDVSFRPLKPIFGFLRLFGIRHLTKRSDTIPKAIVSVANYSIVRILFNLPLSDYQNVVIYPTRLIQSVGMESNSSFAGPEWLLKLHWRGASIAEAPISFQPRTAGTAKGTRLSSIRCSVRDIFRFWFKMIVLGRRGRIQKGRITRYREADWDLSLVRHPDSLDS